MARQVVKAVALAAAIASSGPAAAQQFTALASAGMLTCDVSAGIGLIIGSQKRISCAFAPKGSARREDYDGVITSMVSILGSLAAGLWCGRFSQRPLLALGSWLATMLARPAK
jgi:hypothetical protein